MYVHVWPSVYVLIRDPGVKRIQATFFRKQSEQGRMLVVQGAHSTLLGPQSRFGDKRLGIQAVWPHLGTAVLKGLTSQYSWGSSLQELSVSYTPGTHYVRHPKALPFENIEMATRSIIPCMVLCTDTTVSETCWGGGNPRMVFDLGQCCCSRLRCPVSAGKKMVKKYTLLLLIPWWKTCPVLLSF